MIIQNIHNPKVRYELSRKEWDVLGKSQKVFKIIDETDSPSVKEQILYNSVGKKESINPAKEKEIVDSTKKTFSEKLEEKNSKKNKEEKK